jgi:hypothetical protein
MVAEPMPDAIFLVANCKGLDLNQGKETLGFPCCMYSCRTNAKHYFFSFYTCITHIEIESMCEFVKLPLNL